MPGAVGRDLVGGVLVADRGPRPAEGQGEGEPDIAQADDCHALRHAESLSGRQWLRSHADHRAARRARIGAPQPGVDPNHRRGGGWSLRRRAPQPSVSTGSSHSMRRGLIAGIDAAMPIRTAVPMMAIAAQTRRRVSSTGFRSAIGRHGDAGRRAGGRACCGGAASVPDGADPRAADAWPSRVGAGLPSGHRSKDRLVSRPPSSVVSTDELSYLETNCNPVGPIGQSYRRAGSVQRSVTGLDLCVPHRDIRARPSDAGTVPADRSTSSGSGANLTFQHPGTPARSGIFRKRCSFWNFG